MKLIQTYYSEGKTGLRAIDEVRITHWICKLKLSIAPNYLHAYVHD